MNIVIAIDGYSACGKSTLARQLAARLNYTFIDTGAMYRAITLYFLRNKISVEDEDRIHAALQHIHLHLKVEPLTGENHIYLNGEQVTKAIREMTVSEQVSSVAALRPVRHFAVARQQEMGRKGGVVMDGRDIGTKVFPDAQLKIFMTADMAVRVQRRFAELKVSNPKITPEEVEANLKMRDEKDSNRTESPLRKAEDAKVLDNSHLNPQQQLDIALQWALPLIQGNASQ